VVLQPLDGLASTADHTPHHVLRAVDHLPLTRGGGGGADDLVRRGRPTCKWGFNKILKMQQGFSKGTLHFNRDSKKGLRVAEQGYLAPQDHGAGS
jgi:hypothetical protein